MNIYLRIKTYYNIIYLEREIKKNSSMIYRALLKHGYSNFKLEILEHCDPEKCIEREPYYIDLIKPEYNILKTAGSRLGHKHSEETRAKLSEANKGKKIQCLVK